MTTHYINITLLPDPEFSYAHLLGALVATLVTTFLTEQQIGEWGWRVPFIIGLAIAPVGLWMRRALDETPHFREEQARQARQNTASRRRCLPWCATIRRNC